MPRPRGAAGRAVETLALRDPTSLRKRQQRNADSGMTEVELQFQVEISGVATTDLLFAQVGIDFDYPLYFAPGNRDSDLDRPHFSHGVETNLQAILLCACVSAWDINDDNGAYDGATVQIGVMASETTNFTGYAHLTFQGYGHPAEGLLDSDGDDTG